MLFIAATTSKVLLGKTMQVGSNAYNYRTIHRRFKHNSPSSWLKTFHAPLADALYWAPADWTLDPRIFSSDSHACWLDVDALVVCAATKQDPRRRRHTERKNERLWAMDVVEWKTFVRSGELFKEQKTGRRIIRSGTIVVSCIGVLISPVRKGDNHHRRPGGAPPVTIYYANTHRPMQWHTHKFIMMRGIKVDKNCAECWDLRGDGWIMAVEQEKYKSNVFDYVRDGIWILTPFPDWKRNFQSGCPAESELQWTSFKGLFGRVVREYSFSALRQFTSLRPWFKPATNQKISSVCIPDVQLCKNYLMALKPSQC